MSTCATIRIKSGVAWAPFFVINEADFDASKHERFDATDEPSDEEAAATKTKKAARRAPQEAS